MTIAVKVLDVQPHPDQATNNPGNWATRFEVTYKGHTRTFWRWYTVRALNANGACIQPPTHEQILQRFWDDTFADLRGFSINKDQPFDDGAWP